MDFYLIDPAGGRLHLPVNPGEVSIKREKQHETVHIIKLGEIDFPTGEKVKEIAFSSFFPAEYDPSYCRYTDIPNPQQAMNLLTAWMMNGKPIRLLITNTIINVLVLLSAHSTTFKGGEQGDVYFDLTCRTWREAKIRTSAELAGGQGLIAGTSRADAKPLPKMYTVRPGDSLWKIAKLQLGNGSRWKEIYTLNSRLIGPDPNLIQPGQRLVMPA